MRCTCRDEFGVGSVLLDEDGGWRVRVVAAGGEEAVVPLTYR